MKNPLNRINQHIEQLNSKKAAPKKSNRNITSKNLNFSLQIKKNDISDSSEYSATNIVKNSSTISIQSNKISPFLIEIRKDESEILGEVHFSCVENKIKNHSFILIESIYLNDIIIGLKESGEEIFISESLFLNEKENISSRNDDSIVTVKDALNREFKSFDAVFLELISDINENSQIETFLHKISAKYVPFKKYSNFIESPSHLKLINFPLLNDNIFLLKIELLESFLSTKKPEYEGYSINKRTQNAPSEIDKYDVTPSNIESEFIYLKEISLKEKPIINFNRASICLEILIDEDYLEENFIKNNNEVFSIQNHIRIDDNYYYYFKKNEKKKPVNEIIKSFIGKKGYCSFTHSYETDLLSYKYQDLPPFYTKNYNCKKFKIKFANQSNFISEGRKEQFYTKKNNVIEVQGYVNYTYFFNSKLRVWHIVITPLESTFLNELQIIQISKYFAGLQEAKAREDNQESQADYITFEFGDTQNANIDELFKYLTDIIYQWKSKKAKKILFENYLPSWLKNDNNITKNNEPSTPEALVNNHSILKQKNLLTSGIIAIDMNYNKYLQANNEVKLKDELVNKFHDIYTIIHKRDGDLETDNPEVESVFKALCGVTLGIFDFSRMGIEEISDTLSPLEKSITPTSFLTVNRGVLTSYAFGDDVFNSCHKTLGINPYLMIPSAVLAHNDFVSRDAERRLNRAWELSSESSIERVSMGEIIEERNYIDDLINDDVLPNVFQYPTEQELYSYGMKHRGITERIDEVRAKLIQLDKLIEQKQIHKNQKSEKTIQLILTFLSLLQIASFSLDFAGLHEYSFEWSRIFDFIENPIQSQQLNTVQKWVLSIAILIFGVILYIIWKNSPFRISKKTKNEKFNSF